MTKVKICGITRMEDIAAVNHGLPDYIGFVFAKSPRQVDRDTAAALKSALDKRIGAVGVFVNHSIDEIAAMAIDGIIDMVQLHGEEDGEYIKALRKACGVPVIKSAGIGAAVPKLSPSADYMLFDTKSKQRGGTGRAFDWAILEGYKGAPFFLAGGINQLNIIQAIEKCSPYAVDISSGAETDGIKDYDKIQSLIGLVRGKI